ncbi:MAG: ABC transporter substrate-binding protein [Anaerolineae bacterium]|jgi:peptide/nickel transport system substrate-binding protein
MRKILVAVTALGLVLSAILSISCRPAKMGRDLEAEWETPPPSAEPTSASSALEEPQPGGVAVISYGGGTPRHFNPALVSGSATAIVGTQIFASPIRYDENWNPQPYLAESWSISDDGLSVTLHLVKGATFHDGQPITSEDIAFSLLTVRKYHPFKPMFAPVEQIDTPDPHTAVIHLSRPHPAILLAMSPALLPILPKHVYGDGQDLRTHPANLEPVGSGPFRFVEYVPNESIVLERYDGYFLPGRPYLDSIVFRLEPNPKAQVIEMKRREAHLLAVFTNLDGIEKLDDCEHLIVTQQGYEGIGAINWLAFNLLRKPLADKRVRQAIAYALDPVFITEHLHQGKTQRTTGPIAPASPFYEANVQTYDLDLAKANQLLDEAGYPIHSDGVRFSLTLDYLPVIPSQQRDVALYLRRQLAQVGIDVQVRRSASFPAWAARIGRWDFDMTMDVVFNWGDPVIGVHRTYRSDNIRQGVVWSNTQNYRNPRVDELLSQAERELDKNKRKALYSEFQQIVTEDLPVIWINLLPMHTVYDTGLGNPPLSIWGMHSPLDELYWRQPPTKVYTAVPTPESSQANSLVRDVGAQAIAVLQELGLYEALEVFRDPDQGFLDLEDSGLHIVGFTREGFVFLDNSGQMKPGMDISDILDLEGNKLLPLFLEAAEDETEGYIHLEGVWPHPRTHKVGSMSAWCGMLSEQDVVCALRWDPSSGGEE